MLADVSRRQSHQLIVGLLSRESTVNCEDRGLGADCVVLFQGEARSLPTMARKGKEPQLVHASVKLGK